MMEIRVGDWVAFYREGRLTISEVRYVRQGALGRIEYCTAAGIVGKDSVLEARRGPENA